MNEQEKRYKLYYEKYTGNSESKIYTSSDIRDEQIKHAKKGDKIIVYFNIEYVGDLLNLGHKKSDITFVSDDIDRNLLFKNDGIKTVFFYETSGVAKKLKNKINMEFDFQVSNPPYRNAKGKGRGEPLWKQILKTSLSLNKKDGKISFIIPPAWMSMGDDFKKMLDGHNLTHVYAKQEAFKSFNVGSQFSHLLINNSKNYTGVTVNNENKVDYRKLGFIPLEGDDMTISILKKINNGKEKNGLFDVEWGCNRGRPKNSPVATHAEPDVRLHYNDEIYYHYALEDERLEGFDFPNISTFAKHKKKMYKWSIKPGLAQSSKKIIFTDVSNCIPFYDEGKLGLTDHARGIVVKNKKEANNIMNYLTSPLVNFLTSLIPASGSAGGVSSVINMLPKIKHIENTQEIYEFFGFTKKEIEHVETFRK